MPTTWNSVSGLHMAIVPPSPKHMEATANNDGFLRSLIISRIIETVMLVKNLTTKVSDGIIYCNDKQKKNIELPPNIEPHSATIHVKELVKNSKDFLFVISVCSNDSPKIAPKNPVHDVITLSGN